MTKKNVCPRCGKTTKNPPEKDADGTLMYYHKPVHRDKPIPYWDMVNSCGPVTQEDDDESR